MPDYELLLWNESNSPMEHPWADRMYKKRKWAFVSDYIRFWALEKFGGVYLDTDMEVLRPLDDLLNHPVFFGRSSFDGFISSCIIGAAPEAPFIRAILKEYDSLAEGRTVETSPQVITRTYDHYQNKGEVFIYEPKYLYPCNAGEKPSREKLKEAYTNHHWEESWVSFRRLRRLLRRVGVLQFINKRIR